MNAGEAALEVLLACYQHHDATLDDDCVSIAIGHATALEVELGDDPMRASELYVFYRQWDRTHGLAEDKWLCSWPIDAVREGRLQSYLDAFIKNYETEAE